MWSFAVFLLLIWWVTLGVGIISTMDYRGAVARFCTGVRRVLPVPVLHQPLLWGMGFICLPLAICYRYPRAWFWIESVARVLMVLIGVAKWVFGWEE